jgi:HlyD family secretion protein
MNNTENKLIENLELNSNKAKGSRLKKLIIIIIIIIAGIIGLSLFKGKGTETVAMYKTEQVKRGNLTITVSATGSLKPRNQVDVGSELSGIVKTVDVDYNDHVTKGQILATLDTSKLEAQVKQSKASLEAANAKVLDSEATVKETQDDLNRLRHVWELSGKKVPSLQDLDSAEAALQRAIASEASTRAQVSQAKATLEANETDLDKMVIRSPINGIVLNRDVEPGQTVAASFQAPVLFTLAEDLTKMELSVDVDEADVGMVKTGQDATFTVDAYPEQTFKAKISQVKYGSSTTEGVVTYETILSVDNKELLLRPGMTATAEIIVKNIEDAILLPNAALRYEPPAMKDASTNQDNRSFISRLMPGPRRFGNRNSTPEKKGNGSKKVWVLKDNQPVPVSITIGLTDGTMTQVTGGDLNPGMNAITGSAGR